MSYRNRVALCFLVTCLTLAGFPDSAAAQSELETRLRLRLEAAATSESWRILDERLHARETIRRAYASTGYRPLWVSEDGLSAAGEQLLEWLANEPYKHGLKSEDYHLIPLMALDHSDRSGDLVDFELALSDAFLLVGSHLLAGRLNPESIDSEWTANRRHRDLAPLLERAGTSLDPGAVLAELLPDDERYDALVARLAELRGLRDRGGWRPIAAGPTLRDGDRGGRVSDLVMRLNQSGDLDDAAGDVFNAGVTLAVQRFQTRHGLNPDGVVGAATLSALNVPIQHRIDQIIVNLERWRWLPEDLGDSHIIVNIADFRLDFVRDGKTILDMRVVVGTPFRRTPVFSENVSYLVLNPSWEVPTQIAVQDKLPLIKANPGYLAEQGYTLLQGWGDQQRMIDPATVDWSRVTQRNFGYRLRQSPGPYNALGRVKFMFPNKYAVYLHDTPQRELFAESTRAFSSGCIRVEKPIELTELLLRDDPAWTPHAIASALETGREQAIRLPRRIPVHLLYWTVWFDPDDERLHFRRDIYDRDAAVLRELLESPPS